jgi:hypothetical protein
VAARTFEDSAGTVWEVFEVRRASQTPGAVSPGMERGWLAFVSGAAKRRLAPFPAEWQTADGAELERLCGMARAARAAMLLREGSSAGAEQKEAPTRMPAPRIRRTSGEAAQLSGDLPIVATAGSGDSVEGTVRAFAHQARAHGLPAVEAMVRLKALLARVFADPASEARDVRAVRRWFVEAYYFDRGAPRPETPDQSL